jgi:CYTH domain-containing protein/thymidylate kinase
MFRTFARGFKFRFRVRIKNLNNGLKLFKKQRRSFHGTPKFDFKSVAKKGIFLVGIGGFALAPTIAYFLVNHSEALMDTTNNSSTAKKDLNSPPNQTSSSSENALAKNQGPGDPPIYRIVLTGGPCGGKSTAMAHISDRLQSLGFRVYRVPEAATLFITGGFSPWLMAGEERIAFEGNLVRTKIALEDAFYAIAKASKQPSVIICDRGTMDTSAYLPRETWDIVMDEFMWNVVDLRDKRYDAVIHLVTAAIGAEKYYTTENNTARTESLEQARDLDFKILNAWVGHPRIRIIDNSTDFKGKIQRVIDVVCQVVGAPRPVNIQRKYIATPIDPDLISKLPVKMEIFEVEQTYLAKGKGEEDVEGYTYLRRRGQNGIYTYTHSTIRVPKESDKNKQQHVILERPISGREYVALLKQADPERVTVKKRVYCFLWGNKYYELQTFIEPNVGLTILNTESDQPVNDFPWFLKVSGEVTGMKEFSSYYIAKYYNKLPANAFSDWKMNSSMKDKYDESQKNRQEEVTGVATLKN